MKKASSSKIQDTKAEDLLPEYSFDYKKARSNRFAAKTQKKSRIVVLDPGVSQVFNTSESVNKVLRALINAMPALSKSRNSGKSLTWAKPMKLSPQPGVPKKPRFLG